MGCFSGEREVALVNVMLLPKTGLCVEELKGSLENGLGFRGNGCYFGEWGGAFVNRMVISIRNGASVNGMVLWGT